MNQALIDRIAQAMLYEGYLLYPYRRSTKNQQRWTFGGIFPPGYPGESSETQTQLLLRAGTRSRLTITLRFLQAFDKGEPPSDGWQEAIERSVRIDDVALDDLTQNPRGMNFHFKPVDGVMEVFAERYGNDLVRITVKISNVSHLQAQSPSRTEASKHAMLSAHVVATASDGQFISLIDPPPDCVDAGKACKNTRLWPVLVGNPGETDTVLAVPLILYDYPQIAPESPGDLFDGTEIDEILSLRIMTLTDEEKREAAALDDRAARLIERTLSLAREQLMRLHGAMRQPHKIEAVHIADAELRVGDQVRLRPRMKGRQQGADAFDIILDGKSATIAAIEQDYENRIHLAVTIDDDPGADIGAAGKIGHRFFFGPDEVEPIAHTEVRA
jgi:hypothetical protein